MGLAERRGLARFQDGGYPGWKARIDAAAGFDVAVEVAWQSLAVDGHAADYDEFFAKVYFEPLVAALAAAAADDLGRDALRAGLRQVVIQNSGAYYSPRGFSFDAGVLVLDHLPATNVGDVGERTAALVGLLEANL